MPIKNMTPEEIKQATQATIASGGSSTDPANRLPGETASEANARITAGYKTLTAKPILTAEQEAAGLKVQFVRTGAGGTGEYTVTKPIGYAGEQTTFMQWSEGVIPSTSKYTTGTSLGKYSTGKGTVTSVTGSTATPVTETGRITLPDGSVTISYSNGTTRTVQATANITETGRITNADGSITVMYSNGTKQVIAASVGGNNSSSGSGADLTVTGAPTTNIDVLKSLLKGAGYSAKLIDSSVTYLQQLLKDGIDYDNAVELFLNTKEYTTKNGTKIQSPFYAEYGYLNESAPRPLAASELYGLVEGVKNLVTKYNLNSKFATPESLKKYVSNEVTVSDLEARANTARLKALESDTSYVTALQKLGFIGTAADLTDFYMDPTIGQDTLEMNKRMGTFGAEAIRRASAGIEFGKQQQELAKQLAASTQLKGQDIGAYAATGYANIAETLLPLTSLTGIYERSGLGAQKQDLIQGQIQSELEQEEFMGTASARRKRLLEQNKRAFEGSSGLYSRYGVNMALGTNLTPGIL